MTLIVKQIHGWTGHVWESGDLSIGLVPQVGGRIMSLQFRGEEIFFIQPEYAGETYDLSQLSRNKKDFGFRVWGGDKTWVGPEHLWLDKIPPLDLDAGAYSFDFDPASRTVVMISPVCRETGLQITREVQFGEGNTLTLNETIENKSQSPVRRGIWNVTQLLRPFDIYFPCNRQNVRLYDDEAFQNCPQDQYLDERDNGTVVSCFNEGHFKFGASLSEGKVVALRRTREAILAFSKTFPIIPNAKYGHGSHAEVYNSPYHPYCEMEIHSPMMTLAPGQAFSQAQEWHFESFSPQSITFSQF